MRISAVIPCHNAAPWIGEALRSVTAQTFPACEVIVVDDASTDGSLDAIQAAGVKAHVLRTRKGNAAAARNVGIEAATGDWVAFLDADDMWLEHHLERAATLLREGRDVAFQAFAHEWYADGGIVRRECPWPVAEPRAGLKDSDFVEYFRRHLMFYTSTVVARRDVLVERGMFDPSLPRRHDMDMWLRVTHGHTWAYDPTPHAVYRADTPGSVSRASYASSEYWHLCMLLRHREAYDGPAMRWLLHRGARATMATAFTDGDAEDRVKAREIAWPLLTPRLRAVFTTARLWPGLFRVLNRARRRLRARQRASSPRVRPIRSARCISIC